MGGIPSRRHVFATFLGRCTSLNLTCLSSTPLIMLVLVLVYCLAQGISIGANPVPSIEKRSLESVNPCTDLTHCRTIWNIVWSCLTTIFSCSWVAVHPNIPSPKKREAKNYIQQWICNPLLSFASHRLPLFVTALLVPEYILAWAIRQCLMAKKIVKNDGGELESFNNMLIPLIVVQIASGRKCTPSLSSWGAFISLSVTLKS